MSRTTQITRSTTHWSPNVRGPFRVLAGILAVLLSLSCVGLAIGVFISSRELLIPLVIMVPVTVLMARLALRGSASVHFSSTTTTTSAETTDEPVDGAPESGAAHDDS